jgi:hypothetical protein
MLDIILIWTKYLQDHDIINHDNHTNTIETTI